MLKQRLILALITLAVVNWSCNDDDEPPVPPKLSFAETTRTVKESDRVIDIEVRLDKATPKDIVIEFSLSGTAVDSASVNGESAWDYKVLGEQGELEILQGESSGIIQIELASDLEVEDPETIEIQIDEVDEGIEITREDEINISLEQEDGLGIVLEWGYGQGENYTNVDMDILMWFPDDSQVLQPTAFGAAAASFSSPEFLFLPSALIEDGTYGLSYVYYEGTVTPMNFRVTFAELINGQFEAAASRNVYTGSYTLNNRNKWDQDEPEGSLPILAQRFQKSGTSYTVLDNQINIQANGSRLNLARPWNPEGKKGTSSRRSVPNLK